MKHDPKLVEAVARAVYGHDENWLSIPEKWRDSWRRQATVALDAQAAYLQRKKKEKRRG